MPGNGRKWDQRIARARELAETYPFARQILLFYSQLANFQKSSYLQYPAAIISGNQGRSSLPSALDDIDLRHLLARWRPFLSLLEAEAPGPLAEFARKFKANETAVAPALLRAAWRIHGPQETLDHVTADRPPHSQPLYTKSARGELTEDSRPLGGEAGGVVPPGEGVPTILARDLEQGASFERFCAYAFLQPFAEFLADHADVPTPGVRLATCPFCSSPPLVGVLRPEGEGAKRSLICSFCRTEWDYLRIACPACDERREEKLCVYTTPTFEAVRVEACNTCKAYSVTVDLTKNGLAVPEVDDLAAIPLALWADESGYHRATRNLLSL